MSPSLKTFVRFVVPVLGAVFSLDTVGAPIVAVSLGIRIHNALPLRFWVTSGSSVPLLESSCATLGGMMNHADEECDKQVNN
jgi:hypothetical protein